MTKRIGSLLLALIMTISLAVPAMAVTETEQTEEPTASTVEPTAPTDADTPADTSGSFGNRERHGLQRKKDCGKEGSCFHTVRTV